MVLSSTFPTSQARRLVGVERHPVADGQLHSERSRYLGGSDLGALFECPINPKRTAAWLWAEKSGLVQEGERDNALLRRGRRMERVVAEEFAERFPNLKVVKANEFLCMPAIQFGVHPDFYFTDRETGRFGVLETKSVAAFHFDRSWSPTVPPNGVMLQAAAQGMMCDADEVKVAALAFDGFRWDLHVYDIPRRATVEKRIRDAVADFWQHVKDGTPPALDYDRDAPVLSVLFPQEVPGKFIDLSADNEIREMLEQRADLLGHLDVSERAVTRIETRLKEKIADAEGALVPGWRITFKQQTRKAHSVKESIFRALRIVREHIE